MQAITRGALCGALCIIAAGCGQVEGSVTFATETLSIEHDWGCPSCGVLSNVDPVSLVGDLAVPEISAFGSWSGGYVNLVCDDGSVSDSVVLDIVPADLASGVDLEDIVVPDVDFGSNPDCWMEAVSTSAMETIEVVYED